MAAPPHVPRKPGAARKKNRGRETKSSHTARREPRSSSLSTPAATLWPSTTIGPRRDDDVVGAVEKNLLNADYTLLVINVRNRADALSKGQTRGARFIATADRHTLRSVMCTNCCASHGRRAFRLVHRGRGEKCSAAAHPAQDAVCAGTSSDLPLGAADYAQFRRTARRARSAARLAIRSVT